MTRYVRNDTIQKNLIIRPIFAEIKKLTLNFHNSVPLVQNSEFEAIPSYEASVVEKATEVEKYLLPFYRGIMTSSRALKQLDEIHLV